ncbi:hypothetical protein LTR28_007878 [Elasticomyces elasticus]|nr:hypothetical protein LTR28_007878 [Elasticomyces elasticus]
MEMMHEQDEALDGVFRTVGNLRLQADTMGRELEEQAELLDDVDNVADRVGGKLQTGIKKIGWVIKKNEEPVSQHGTILTSNDKAKDWCYAMCTASEQPGYSLP